MEDKQKQTPKSYQLIVIILVIIAVILLLLAKVRVDINIP